METIINNVHLRILKNKTVYQIFANGGILPIDMEYRGKRGWEFISDETPKPLIDIQSQISDFIKVNSC